MAKKEAKVEVEANVENIDTQEVEKVNETPETPEAQVAQVKEPEESKTETVRTAAQVATTEKLVKVHTIEEVNCTIAGVSYSFAKGKDVKVPTDVAAILVNAQKVYRN